MKARLRKAPQSFGTHESLSDPAAQPIIPPDRLRPPVNSIVSLFKYPMYAWLLLIPPLRLSQRFFLWGFAAAPGFACKRCVGFKHFWPLSPIQPAPAAIITAAPGGKPSGLTLRSSGLAYGKPLTLSVRYQGGVWRTIRLETQKLASKY